MQKFIRSHKKTIWATVTTIGFVLGSVFSGIGTKFVPGDLFNASPERSDTPPKNVNKDQLNLRSSERVSLYDQKYPILDGNLFVEKHYNHFKFGGVNFDIIQLAARTEYGEKAKILEKGEYFTSFQVYHVDRIEFSYKSKFYSIEIEKDYRPVNEIDLFFKVSQISRPSMALKLLEDL